MNTKNAWDAIVIGTGPAGATVARDLAKRKKKVLILEKGKLDYSIHIPSMLKNKEMLYIGKGKTLVRGIRTGGTSVLYYGTAYEPPKEYFLQYGIDLSGEFDELRSELPVAPLRDELIGPSAKKIMQSATGLGYPWRKLDKFIYQDNCAPGHFPDQAQWNATEYITEAIEAGAAMLNGADVKRVILSGKEAVGVEYIDSGIHQKVYAPKIVLAAGGIASAQILNNSGINTPEGFFCDPIITVQGIGDGIQAGNEIPMAAGMICKQEGYILTDITLPRLVYQLFSAQALRFHRLFNHGKTVSIMVKVRDSLGGRITKKGNIRKEFTDQDKGKMENGLAHATKILEHAGVKKIFRTVWTAAHPGGSVRIGGAVDSNLQTEYDNLYVCDCSVLPTEWGLPPTFTLLALAKRLAKRL